MEDGDIDAWAISIKEKLPRLKSQTSSTITIPRVPERFRKGENDVYDPQVISFGPYHHGEQRLQAMEKYKWSYLEAILLRNPHNQLQQYIHKIKEIEAETRRCYPDHFDIESTAFVEMILIDACFIVEYIFRGVERIKDEVDSMNSTMLLDYDMLKLENQLPFFILNDIFDLSFNHSSSTKDSSCPSSFTNLVVSYFNVMSDKENHDKELNLPPTEPIHHLLHLYHSFCLYPPEAQGQRFVKSTNPIDEPTSTVNEKDWSIMIPSVAVLQEAGIRFRRKETEGSSLDVSFNEGEMKIPQLIIGSSTKSALRNFIAFEQFYPDYESNFYKSFTAYGVFMNDIVDTPGDVALLCEEDIIRHSLGSNEDVARFFNNLSNGAILGRINYLNELYKNVDKYRKARWHRWRANLMHNYFNSPWAVVSVLAGGILLLLTFLQTFFSAYSAF